MIIATGKCEDAERWEKGFRRNASLFRLQAVISPIHFNVNDKNEFAILFETDDLEQFQEVLESEATIEAMASDGVIEGTIKIFLLDREFDLNTPD
jgi:hypothetical protein